MTTVKTCWWTGAHVSIKTPRNAGQTSEPLSVSHWVFDQYANAWYWLTDSTTAHWYNEVWNSSLAEYTSMMSWAFWDQSTGDPEYWNVVCQDAHWDFPTAIQNHEFCQVYITDNLYHSQSTNPGADLTR